MKRLFAMGVVACLAGVSGIGQDKKKEEPAIGFPTLKVENAMLELRSLSVSVEVNGLIAETVYELEFFNHTPRRQEGEFMMKLPENATVSTYALDINGHMRPGVSVEKARARHAYETIKRQQIDPGLVEREKGNVYRTRIFPIEPNQPKRVRIGFIEPLEVDGEYLLLLTGEKQVRRFSCTVKSEEMPDMTVVGLQNRPEVAGAKKWSWDGVDVVPKGTLKVKSTIPGEKPSTMIRQQSDGSAHFVVQGKLPPEPEEKTDPKANWKNVRLIWDTSFTGRFRDHDNEIAALNKIWKWVGNCTVQIVPQSYRAGEGKVFHVKGGDGSEIGAFLKTLTYDGAADFSKTELSAVGPTVIVTDGRIGSPGWNLQTPQENADVFVMTTGSKPDAGLMRVASSWLNLAEEKSWWKEVTDPEVKVQLRGMPNEDWDVARNGDFYAITGQLPKNYHAKVTVEVAGEEVLQFTKNDGTIGGGDNWNLARRVWAERRLAALEREGNETMITVFAKQERLVSDYTSLIVLERFQDHITYRIPPPEPELLAEYHRAIETQEQEVKKTAIRDWQSKISWHKFDYPWMDAELKNDITNVAIWVKASRTAFPKPQQNQEALARFDQWLRDSVEITNRKNTIQSKAEFKKWKDDIGTQVVKLEAIRNGEVPAHPNGHVHVSVRGFVKKRGIRSGRDGEFDLRDAIRQAGGSSVYGSLSRVYLYRNAQRTGYNLHNRDFGDVPLKWGDMIVVEEHPDMARSGGWAGGGGAPAAAADPFADPVSSDAFADTNGPAVFEQPGAARRTAAPAAPAPVVAPGGAPGQFVDPFETEADPFGTGRTDNPNRLATEKMTGKITPMAQKFNGAGEVDGGLLVALRESDDPVAHYQKLLSEKFGKGAITISTAIEVARFFYEKKKPDVAESVLSNLSELQPNSIEGIRSFAFWLAELGQKERALEILGGAIDGLYGDPATVALLNFDSGQISDSTDFFREAVASELDLSEPTALSTISLTDYFGRGGEPEREVAAFEQNPMPSDIRIVITTAGDGVSMDVIATEVSDLIKYGARQRNHERVHEFQIRQAMPGNYRVILKRPPFEDADPVTVRATYYLRWANGDNEKTVTRTTTRIMNGTRLELDGVEFDWGK